MGFFSSIFGGGGSSVTTTNKTTVNTSVEVNPNILVESTNILDTAGIEALVSKFTEDEAVERDQLAGFLTELSQGQKANLGAALVANEQNATGLKNIMLLGLGFGAFALMVK
ncbi:MAG: hypothetical protein JKY94_01940 [Rhodobacteraceae bacterium]|nr:hypothetical protein [Paracoccaceae bacterium]